MKVRARQAVATDGRLIVTDDNGRVWERNESMPLGEWGQVTLPEEPRPKQRRRKRLRP